MHYVRVTSLIRVAHIFERLVGRPAMDFDGGRWQSFANTFSVYIHRKSLSSASKTYIGSVLFRTSAYTGAKQAGRVPFWFRELSRQNHLLSGHLIPCFRLGHLVPSFIMGFNSLMLFFYVSKFTLKIGCKTRK